MVVRLAALAVAVALAGCPAQPAFHPRWPDAQLELRDDGDRDQAIDQLWIMPPGAARDAARDRIVAAIARRITDAIEDDQPLIAASLLDQLTNLWQRDPGTVGTGLAH